MHKKTDHCISWDPEAGSQVQGEYRTGGISCGTRALFLVAPAQINECFWPGIHADGMSVVYYD